MQDILNQVIWGNSVRDWLTAFGIVAGCMLILRLLKPLIIHGLNRWSESTSSDIDDFMVVVVKRSILPGLYFLALFIAHNYLNFSKATEHRIRVAFMIIATYYVLRAITFAAQFLITRFLRKQDNGEARENHAKGLIPILNGMLWIAGFVFLLDNLGYDVTTVITGLGIGGIAIALAAQAILADLFSYFVILFDRPVEIGDYIVLDDKKGTVEYVGLKTTRLRSLSGEQIILSNTNLTNSRVHNFKRLHERRIIFTLTFNNQTPLAALKTVPALVKNIIESEEDTRYDRGHFVSMSPTCTFEFVYFVTSIHFDLYMDRQESVNYRIMELFKPESPSGIVLESLNLREAARS